jgi:hypothetical protein
LDKDVMELNRSKTKSDHGRAATRARAIDAIKRFQGEVLDGTELENLHGIGNKSLYIQILGTCANIIRQTYGQNTQE